MHVAQTFACDEVHTCNNGFSRVSPVQCISSHQQTCCLAGPGKDAGLRRVFPQQTFCSICMSCCTVTQCGGIETSQICTTRLGEDSGQLNLSRCSAGFLVCAEKKKKKVQSLAWSRASGAWPMEISFFGKGGGAANCLCGGTELLWDQTSPKKLNFHCGLWFCISLSSTTLLLQPQALFLTNSCLVLGNRW